MQTCLSSSFSFLMGSLQFKNLDKFFSKKLTNKKQVYTKICLEILYPD